MPNLLSASFLSALPLLLGGSAVADQVQVVLKDRLPKTPITSIECEAIDGLCEVVAGDNLFYVDKGGRYLVIGRVYDMQTRQDLTAARLLQLNPDMLVGGAAKANANRDAGEDEAAPTRHLASAQAALTRNVDLSALSPKGAIVWGRGGGPTVTVFSDFHCGYCRALAGELETMNVRVVERPISVLGSRDIADRVLCAKDRHAAVRAAYARDPIASGGTCDTSGLDENERFARAHGFSGTPVLVRSDGAVLEGYRPKAALIAWLKGARS